MNRRTRRPRSSELRKRRKDRLGMALCAAVALGFAGMLTGAYQIDKAHGITPAESMCGNGFSGFCSAPAKAREARLIGRCDGRLMAGLEEDSFPAGCEWIEPVRVAE